MIIFANGYGIIIKMITIGTTYILKNCKHKWNNGIKIIIIGYNNNLALYNAVNINNSDNLFLVDINNLRKIE